MPNRANEFAENNPAVSRTMRSSPSLFMSTMTNATSDYNLGDYVFIEESPGKALPAKIVKCTWKNQTYAGKWRIDVPQYRMSTTSNPKLSPTRSWIRQYFCRLVNKTRPMWVNVDNIVRRAPELKDRFATPNTAVKKSDFGSLSRGSGHRAAFAEKSDAAKESEDTAKTSVMPVRRSTGTTRAQKTTRKTSVESSAAEIGNDVPEVASKGPPRTTPGSGSTLIRNTPQPLLYANSSKKAVAETRSGSKPQDLGDVSAGSLSATAENQPLPIVAVGEVIPVDAAILNVHSHIGDTVEDGNAGKAKPSLENEKEPEIGEQDSENHVPSADLFPRADAVNKSSVTEAEKEKENGDNSIEKVASSNDCNIQHGQGAVLQQEGDNSEGKEDRGDNVEADCDRPGEGGEHAVDALELNEEDHAEDGEEGIAAPSELQTGAVEDAEKPKCILGDVVFAQYGKSPYWPAIVGRCDWESEYWKWRREDKDELFVRFFGENSSAWVLAANVKPFTPDGSRIRKKHLVKAIKSAKKYIEEGDAKRMEVEQREVDDELGPDEVDFKIDDFVMAQMWGHPFWPATIKRCPWSKDEYKGKWKLTDPVRYWCSFPDESGNWVESRSMKPFYPAEVRTYITEIKARKTLLQDIETMTKLFNERNDTRNVEEEQGEQEEQDDHHEQDKEGEQGNQEGQEGRTSRIPRRRGKRGSENKARTSKSKKIRTSHNDE